MGEVPLHPLRVIRHQEDRVAVLDQCLCDVGLMVQGGGWRVEGGGLRVAG